MQKKKKYKDKSQTRRKEVARMQNIPIFTVEKEHLYVDKKNTDDPTRKMGEARSRHPTEEATCSITYENKICNQLPAKCKIKTRDHFILFRWGLPRIKRLKEQVHKQSREEWVPSARLCVARCQAVQLCSQAFHSALTWWHKIVTAWAKLHMNLLLTLTSFPCSWITSELKGITETYTVTEEPK